MAAAMQTLPIRWLILILISTWCRPAVAYPQTGAASQAGPENSATAQALALSQVQELIKLNTPDATIAHEVRRRGVSFSVTPSIVQQFETLGAGPETLQVLRGSMTPQAGAYPQTSLAYFPLQEGMVFRYQMTSGAIPGSAQNKTIEWRVLGPREIDDKKVIPIRTSPSGLLFFLAEDNAGISKLTTQLDIAGERNALGSTLIMLKPAQSTFVLKYPIRVGTTWDEYVLDLETARQLWHRVNLKARIESTDETVTVPAGRFEKCLKVRSAGSTDRMSVTTFKWYAPGVGMIKRTEYWQPIDRSAQSAHIAYQLEGYRYDAEAEGKMPSVEGTPASHSAPASLGQFVGTWKNEDVNAQGLTRVEIRPATNNVFVRIGDYEDRAQVLYLDSTKGVLCVTKAWGLINLAHYRLSVLPDGRMQVAEHTEFRDNSGRDDQDYLGYFVKSSNDAPN